MCKLISFWLGPSGSVQVSVNSIMNPQVPINLGTLQVGVIHWHTEGGLGVQTPPPEIPKALQNRAKLNPIVKTVKNC